MVIHPKYCTIHVYRLVVLSKFNDMALTAGSKSGTNGFQTIGFAETSRHENSDLDEIQSHHTAGSLALLGSGTGGSMSSMSSTQSGSVAFNRIIKDFKKALGERKTPRNLVYLNRIMKLILLTTIILSAIDFGIHKA